MIKHMPLFAISICCIAAGAILRHLDMEQTPPVGLLLDYRIWIGAGILFLLTSLLVSRKTKSDSSDKKKAGRAGFIPENTQAIGQRVQLFCQDAQPDIPLIVDYIIFQAIEKGASDIHFDPGYSGMQVKFRTDGMMKSITRIQKKLTPPIINRLKVLSNLVVYKDALPQDGRLKGVGTSEYSQKELARSGLARSDFRIAFMPTLHGERIVIRILAKGGAEFNLSDLGMTESELATMTRLVAEPQGMIILTGPTGSGKSTTIYAALHAIMVQSDFRRSIATLEDPIEYDLEGVNQSQVDEAKNFTFDKGLRAILRQDPDVIMVGEIRDQETARIAVQAGMTGHLIITTVHAGSTASVFSRLLEMGIPAYSLNSSLTAIIAQRLVRRICPNCRTEREISPAERLALETDSTSIDFPVFYGQGCSGCAHTGYLGRVALYEILEVTEGIRRLVSNQVPTEEIYKEARESGIKTLFEASLDALRLGLTTPEEVLRVISRELR